MKNTLAKDNKDVWERKNEKKRKAGQKGGKTARSKPTTDEGEKKKVFWEGKEVVGKGVSRGSPYVCRLD